MQTSGLILGQLQGLMVSGLLLAALLFRFFKPMCRDHNVQSLSSDQILPTQKCM